MEPFDYIDNETKFRIYGMLGHPQIAKKTRSYSSLFINQRYILSDVLFRAINEAYEGTLMISKYPFFIDATRSGKVSENKMVQKMNFETIPEFVQQLFTLGTALPNRIFVIDSWNAVIGNLSETQIHHWESAIVQRVQGKNDKIVMFRIFLDGCSNVRSNDLDQFTTVDIY